MEKAYDLGQRLERLLYTSVIVIILGFIILSLSKSLAISKSINTFVNYQNIVESLKNNQSGIDDIKKIESSYQDYKKREDKKKADFETQEKENLNKKASNIIAENKVREALSLPPMPFKEELFQSLPYINYDVELKKINKIRRGVSLPNISSLDDSNQGYKDIIFSIIRKETNFNYPDIEKMRSVLESNNYDTGKFIDYLNNQISNQKKQSIKILDIDTPVDVPLSIGTMQLNIPMSNIEGWALKVAPVFLVIWIGSIFITRSFEIIQLLESKKIMSFYPHILNFFNVKSETQNSNKINDVIARAKAGSRKDISRLRRYSIFLSVFRIFVLVVMLLSMTIPVYWGFYIYLSSDINNGFTPYIISIIIPGSINVVQILSCVKFELIASKKTFIVNGDDNETI